MKGAGFKIYYQLTVTTKFSSDGILIDSAAEHHAIGNADDGIRQ